MGPRRFGCLLLSSSLLFSVAARAQGTKVWKQSSYDSFEKGTPKGVAIGSDGTLQPAPVAENVLTTPAAYVWSVAVDAHGNAYLGTGSPAMVLKVTPDGKFTKLLETKDVSVQVVRLGPDGMLYAATLPNGKVYRIDPNGPAMTGAENEKLPASSTVIFDTSKLDPKPAYIWDLAFDKAGLLYIATGGPAAIYRVDPKQPAATPDKFFSSDEQHIRSLVFAKDGTLYAGTDGRGLVYRIGPDGKGFVLFETPKLEIPALALDPAGNLYVAALGEKTRSPLPPISVHSGPEMTATIHIVIPGSVESSNDSTIIPEGTVIYRISPDGSPRQLWASQHDVIYTLAWQQDKSTGGLLAGSGNEGHVYLISADGTYADIAHLEAKQATALAQGAGGVYVGTSNIGKLYRMAEGGASTVNVSTYESRIYDAKFFSQWGRAQVRGMGSYDLFARTGNIEQPKEGWSDWRKLTPNAGAIGVPKARFLQWKAVLHPGAKLDEIGFYFLPQNVAPAVDEIVLRLHSRVKEGMNPAAQAQQAPIPITFPSNPADGLTYTVANSAAPLMAMRDPEWATTRWKAHDDNGDKLEYSVYYRGDAEANWQLLDKNLKTTYASFDLRKLPDGGYTLRVVASDAPSHPAGDALTGFKDSAHFVIDTAPPVLSGLHANETNGAIHLIFSASDAASTVARAYYSVDAGPWQYFEPIGKLSDSPQERYDIMAKIPKRDPDATLPPAAPQQHVIAVRVYDSAGNVATGKAVVQ